MTHSECRQHTVMSVYVNNSHYKKFGFFNDIHMPSFIQDVCNANILTDENKEKFVEIIYGSVDSKEESESSIVDIQYNDICKIKDLDDYNRNMSIKFQPGRKYILHIKEIPEGMCEIVLIDNKSKFERKIYQRFTYQTIIIEMGSKVKIISGRAKSDEKNILIEYPISDYYTIRYEYE